MSLVTKLAEVLKEVGWVPKRGRNDFHKYDFVRESDLMDVVREKLAERQLFLFISVVDSVIEHGANEKGRSYVDAQVRLRATFVDGETKEEMSIEGLGHSMDTGDKAVPKAITAGVKYIIMKNFLVSSGDDPEISNEAGDGGSRSAAKVEYSPEPRFSKPPAPPEPKPEGPPAEVERWRIVDGPIAVEGKNYVHFKVVPDKGGDIKKRWAVGANLIAQLQHCFAEEVPVALEVNGKGQITAVHD